MQQEQSIRKFIDDARTSLIQDLKSYDQHLQKLNKQSTCTKLKIVLGLLQQNSMEELDQQLADFNDPGLADILKLLKQNEPKPISTQAIPKENVLQKPKQPQTQKEPLKNKTSQPTKRNTSIIKSVLGKFIKQQENVRQMILPENEKKRYYDYEKKRYVFEGQEQEEVKQIPKPPPARKTNPAQIPASKPKQKSQLDDLMAPPSYKRKGKKNEVQIKQKKVEISLELLEDKINGQLLQVTQKFLAILEEQRGEWSRKSVESVHVAPAADLPSQVFLKIKNIDDQIKESRKMGERLEKILSDSMRLSNERSESDRYILEKMIIMQKQNEQILKLGLRRRDSTSKKEQKIEIRKKIQNQEKEFERKLAEREKQIESKRIKQEREAQDRHQHQLDQYIKQNSQLRSQVQSLTTQIQILQLKISEYQAGVLKFDREIRSRSQEYKILEDSLIQKTNLIAELNRGAAQNIGQAHQFQQQLEKKQKEISNLKKDLAIKADQSKKYHSQIVQLKEKVILAQKNIKNQQEEILQKLLQNSSILSSINEALIAQNQLYNTIRSKRKQEKSLRWAQKFPNESRQNPLFQLSDCLTKIVEHYESQIDRLAKQYAVIQNEYEELKGEGSRVHQNLISQNQALQRSLSRTKQVMQENRQSKSQTQRKVGQLQNENEGLRRQIIHLRKQQKYTKQLLEKNIRSHHDNTTTIKEQLEAEVKSLEQQLQQSKQREKLIRGQLFQLQQKIEQVSRQSKSKGIRISQMEKDIKSVKLTLQEKQGSLQCLQLKIKQIQQERESQKSKFQQEKLKLENIVKKNKMKIKEVEEQSFGFERSFKEQRKRVQQLLQKEQALKNDNKEIMSNLQEIIQENEEFKLKVKSFEQNISSLKIQMVKLQSENGRLVGSLEESEEKNRLMEESLGREILQISSMKNESNEYQRLFREQNQQLGCLMNINSTLRNELGMIDREYRKKIEGIYSELSSLQDMEELRESLSEYQKLMRVCQQKMKKLQEQIIQKENEKRQSDKEHNQLVRSLEQKLRESEERAIQIEELRRTAENESILKQQIQDLSRKVLEKQKKLSGEITIRIKAEQQKQQIYKITQEMEKEINQLRSTIENQKRTNIQSESEIALAKNKYREVVELNEGYLLVIRQKQKEIELLSSKIVEDQQSQRQKINEERQKDNINKQLTNQISILEDEKQKLIQFSTQLQQEISQLQQKHRQIIKNRELQEQRRIKEKDNEINTLLLNLEQSEEKITQHKSIIEKQEKQIQVINQVVLDLKNSQKEKQDKILILSQKEKEEKRSDKTLSPKQQLINSVDNARQLFKTQIEQKQRLAKQLENISAELSKVKVQKEQMNGQMEQLLLELEAKSNQVLSKDQTIQQLRKQLEQHETNIGQLLLKLEEGQKKREELKEKLRKNEYQAQLKRGLQDNQQQSDSVNELQRLAMVQDAKINQQALQITKLEDRLGRLNEEIKTLQNTNQELKRQKNELNQLYINKSEHAQKTIEQLQQKLRQNKKNSHQVELLNNRIKDLQSEVTLLLSDKTDLLKRNNQISEILAQRSSKGQASDGIKQNGDSPIKVNKKEQNVSPPSSVKKVHSQVQAPRPSGFLGSLSSFFLTPTENQKLAKIPK